MRAQAFRKPASLAEALALRRGETDAMLLGGGASLVAMMNAGLVAPETIISLADIAELATFRVAADGTATIGAMRRHRQTASQGELAYGQRVVSAAAAEIANPVVRNMGTIGGSIALSDPAADYPPALVAAGAAIEIAGTVERRRVPAEAFFLDWYTTALRPDEIITAVHLPSAAPGSVGLYRKLARVSGDFAIASVAIVLTTTGAKVDGIRIVVGGCGPTPVRSAAAEAILMERGLTPPAIEDAGQLIAAACEPLDDVRASAAYRRRVVPRLIAQSLAAAQARGAGEP